MLNRPAIIALLLALGWGAASGCVSNTKTGTEPSEDIAQVVDAVVDTQADAHMPDSAKDLGPEPDTAGPQDVSPEDTAPPTWPEGASLLASDIEPTSLTLSWPFATDDTQVTSYQVLKDGLQVASVSALQTDMTLTNLEVGSPISVSVTAKDAAGNTSEPLTLTVATNDVTPPVWSKDATLLVTQLWDTGALLAWTGATDDVQVAEYRIMDGDEVIRTINGSTQGDVSTLLPWSEYTLSIIAVDGAGNVSGPGPSVSFKTPDSGTPIWPEGAALETDAPNPTSVTLSWPEAADEAGVTAYEIFQDKVLVDTLGDELKTTIDGLGPATLVTFSVRAKDAAGNASFELTATLNPSDVSAPWWPEGASMLASDVSSQQLTLGWIPASDDVGVNLYRVYQGDVEIAAVQSTTYQVGGLSPWTLYGFSVRAEDGAGNLSDVGPSVSVQTLDEVAPTWPGGSTLSAANITPTSLTLTWSQATDDVAVTGYRITRGVETVAEVAPDVTSFDVTDLNPWSVHVFRVEAVDAAGNWSQGGPFLAHQSPDTSAPTWVPGAALTASGVTPHAFTISWPGANDDVAVTQYRIRLDGADWGTLDSATTSLTLENLSPWTDYALDVSARDAAGNWSETSLSLTVKTTDDIAPMWPPEGMLSASNVEPFSVTLSWPPAFDDVAVTAYAINLEGAEVLVVGGNVTETLVEGLSPLSSQTLTVEARDAAGNASTTLSVSVDTPDDCYDDLQQFHEEIWQPFMAGDCIACHIQGGQAGGTQLVLEPGMSPDAIAANFETIENLALDKSMGASLLILKPTGQVAHGGGQRFAEGDAIYDSFIELIARYEEPGGCEDPSIKYACENAPINPGPTHLRRLTNAQYHNTILDLFGGLIDSGVDFPQTTIHAGFSSYAGPNLVSAAGAQSIFDSAENIGAQIAEDVDSFLQCGNTPEPSCIVDFIKSFGMKAFRRPVTNGELAAFFTGYQQAPYGTTLGDKVARIVEAFLQSPQFLYIHAEEGAPVAEQPGVVALSEYAMASRLSYFLWDSMPDQVLFDRASAGDLNNPAAITDEVNRMLQDPRAQTMVARFHDEWLHLYKLEDAVKDPELYPQFNEALAAAMRHETDLLVQHVVFDGDGLFNTLMTTTTSFVNPELGDLYGVDVSNLGEGEWAQMSIGDQRPGITTRAAFGAAHSYAHGSSPIHRGHFIIEGLLCQKLVIPPVDIGELPEVPQGTIKDRLEQHRTDPMCASCHDKMDPLGLAYENFDAIGQWRDDYGNGLPVDATGTLDSPDLNFVDAADLVDQLANQELIQACYAKQWFRYATGRGDQPQDKCSIEAVRDTFYANGGNVLGLIHAITQSDSFRYRWDSNEEAAND